MGDYKGIYYCESKLNKFYEGGIHILNNMKIFITIIMKIIIIKL
jgi:hypothetical protein